MKHLISSVESAIVNQNWYAALSLALALPDICGWAEDPNRTSKERYVDWFDHFLLQRYTSEVGAARETVVFLSGSDCYALRCAFIHEGRDDIKEQRAREVLGRFQFTVAPAGWTVHRNRADDQLQLQVDIFCRDILAAVLQWIDDVSSDSSVQGRLANSLRIYDVNGSALE